MIAQLCNSHGFFHGWQPTPYHHEVFRKIVDQIEEHYTGNCIVVDDTWLDTIANEKTFVTMYPNVMREDIEHIFFVSLVDSQSAAAQRGRSRYSGNRIVDQDIIQQLTTARQKHNIITNSKFSFWAYFCQNEYNQYHKQNFPWIGDKLFLSYNRKPAVHRVKLVDGFKAHDLMDCGIVTLGNDDPAKALTVKENYEVSNENVDGNVGIPNDITTIGNHKIWQDAFINIVAETWTHGDFLSEKIWKPIIGKRPFMLVGPPGSIRKLRDLGFKTFDGFWNESYNEITQNSRRLNQLHEEKSIESICQILDELNKHSTSQLKNMYMKMQPILEHNHKHFFETFAQENRARMDTIVQDEING